LALGLPLLLAACGGNEAANDQSINPGFTVAARRGYDEMANTRRTFAGAVADESHAAEIGRDILLNGGNATDAAVAMYFAMAVTLPSAAGLGASGACVVQDSKTKGGEAFVFAPTAAPGPIQGTAVSIPVGPRAIALMQVRHGQAHWQMDVAPAEKLARFGFKVSPALARDLRSAQLDGEAQRVFTRSGAPLGEGDTVTENDLASTLGAIRQRGATDFFQGNLARVLESGVSQLGGSLPVAALRAAVPQAGPPLQESYYGFKLYTAPAPFGGQSVIAAWNGQGTGAGAVANDSGGYAGFAATDDSGGAAACSLTMGQPFGSHRMVPGTGVILATMGNVGGISPLVIGNPNNSEYKFAGAGGGSPNSAAAVGLVARETVRDDRKLAAVMNARAGQGGFVSALVCPGGKGKPASCQMGADPAGAGLAAAAGGE
jgi:gamma-glutamyltranspeptidase/glutathione hydrolase